MNFILFDQTHLFPFSQTVLPSGTTSSSLPRLFTMLITVKLYDALDCTLSPDGTMWVWCMCSMIALNYLLRLCGLNRYGLFLVIPRDPTFTYDLAIFPVALRTPCIFLTGTTCCCNYLYNALRWYLCIYSTFVYHDFW